MAPSRLGQREKPLPTYTYVTLRKVGSIYLKLLTYSPPQPIRSSSPKSSFFLFPCLLFIPLPTIPHFHLSTSSSYNDTSPASYSPAARLEHTQKKRLLLISPPKYSRLTPNPPFLLDGIPSCHETIKRHRQHFVIATRSVSPQDRLH